MVGALRLGIKSYGASKQLQLSVRLGSASWAASNVLQGRRCVGNYRLQLSNDGTYPRPPVVVAPCLDTSGVACQGGAIHETVTTKTSIPMADGSQVFRHL